MSNSDVLLMWQEKAGNIRLRRYPVSDYAWQFQRRLLVAAGYKPCIKYVSTELP